MKNKKDELFIIKNKILFVKRIDILFMLNKYFYITNLDLNMYKTNKNYIKNTQSFFRKIVYFMIWNGIMEYTEWITCKV